MRASTSVILVASIGFILMGVIVLKSKKIKKILDDTQLYNDTKKFIGINSKTNISIGIIGLILGMLDYFFIQWSKYIVLLFIIIMAILLFVQSKIGKQYRGF